MELIRRYNEIAGAPDYVGGSGLYITEVLKLAKEIASLGFNLSNTCN